MQKTVHKYLYAVPVLHILFAVLVFGNNDIFFEFSTGNQIAELAEFKSNSNDILANLQNRLFSKTQNIVLTIILFLVIIFLIFKYFLLKPVKKFFSFCLAQTKKKLKPKKPEKEGENTEKKEKKKSTPLEEKINNNQKKNYFQFLDQNQIEDEVKLINWYDQKIKTDATIQNQISKNKNAK